MNQDELIRALGVYSVTDPAGGRKIKTDSTFSGALTVNIDETTDSVAIFGSDGIANQAIKTDASGNIQTNVLNAADAVINPATSENQTNGTQQTKITDGTDTALVTAAGQLNVIAVAQPGVDIGDVTVNNGAGAAAVNIQDGGNSITVDSTTLATEATLLNIETQLNTVIGSVSNLDVALSTVATEITLAAIEAGVPDALGQTTMAASMPVTFASDQSALPVTVTSVTPGVGATDLGKAEDSGHASGDVGVMSLAVRNDANADFSDTDLDYTPLAVTAKGVLKVSGDVADNAAQVNLNPSYSGARAEDITALPAFTVADSSGLRSNNLNGTLLVNQGNLSSTQDSVTAIQGESTKQTYSASATGIAAVAAATDIFEIIGSGTKTIRVKRIEISGTATAAGAIDVLLIKRSAANTAGTASTSTNVPHDSTNGAATSVVKSYTANPTLGAAVGTMRSIKPTLTTAAGAIPNIITTMEFGETGLHQSIVLRGVAETLAINLNGATIAGNSFNLSVTWTEE